MSSVIGSKALEGEKELVEAHHEFTVDNQTAVIAEGMMIMIFKPNVKTAIWYGKETGPKGIPVSEGYKVVTYNASVQFKR
ncbi:hypothetical protein CABS03_15135 [Colletotrichum abscissum]|uniref:Uncharacterized protein n=1 Tax=Colletotrichum abscissum TaxID=1671311 RepID=A0A9P9X111_9PEZI|nr:hypothetical protein CABS02_14520 [Colletotrichum abscissum]